MSSLEKDLGLKWAEARVVDGSRLRHPSGAEMAAVFLGAPDAPLFAVLHRPPRPPRGVVVVCSPPYAEAARNQRRELLFGWLASDRDLAVARFHPRGFGHSGGETADVTLETMQEDASTVAREAVDQFGAPLIGFVGSRLGGVVAHRAALKHPGASVVWWHPVLEASAYMRELLRASMIGALKRGITTSGRELEARFKSDGVLDVLGSPITRRFYESMLSRPLDDAPSGPRHGLVVQMSRHEELQPQFDAFVGKLRQGGWTANALLIPDEETWWFGARGRGTEFDLRAAALEVVPVTVDFFNSSMRIQP